MEQKSKNCLFCASAILAALPLLFWKLPQPPKTTAKPVIRSIPHFQKKGNENMLPSQITVSGAGKSADNVTLTLASVTDSQGYQFYTSGTASTPAPSGTGVAAYFNSGLNVWYITNPSKGTSNNWTSSGGTGSPPTGVDYYSSNGQNSSNFPTSPPWTTTAGTPTPGAFSATTPVPSAPTNVTVTPGNNQNAITWVNGSGSTTANVYRSTNSSGPFATLSGATGLTGSSYTDTTAVNGTTYYYTVSNTNSGGEGPQSSPAVAGTPSAMPAGPTGLTATYVAGSGIQLSWTNPSGNNYTGINVYRLSGASVNGTFQRQDPVPQQPLPVTTSFLDKPGTGFISLTGSPQHSYAVCGVINNAESQLSNIAGPVTFSG